MDFLMTWLQANGWLLVVISALLALLITGVIVLLVYMKRAKIGARKLQEEVVAAQAREKEKEASCLELTERNQNLRTELADARALASGRADLLFLLARAHASEGGRVGAFAFDNETGEELLADACDEALRGALSSDEGYSLRERLLRMAEDEKPTLLSGKYYTVSRTLSDDSEIYILTDVTDTCRIPALVAECEKLTTRDAFTDTTMEYRTFLAKQNESFADGTRTGTWVLLLQTEPVNMPATLMGDYKETYVKACADIFLAEFGWDNVARCSEISFCCVFEAATSEEALAVAERVSAAVTEKRRSLWPADNRFVNDHAMMVASFAGTDLTSFMECLSVKARWHIKHGEFGVREFARTEYPLIVSYKKQVERTLKERKVRFFYRPIAYSNNARVLGYEMLPFFPVLPFRSTEEMLEWGGLLGYANELENLLLTECMQVYAKAVDNAVWLGSARVLLHSLEGSCMVKKVEEDFHEKHYDLLPNIILELSEQLPEERLVGSMKRGNVEKWKAECTIRLTEDMLDNGARVAFFDPHMVRISADVIKSSTVREQLEPLITGIHENGGKVMVDGITLPGEVDIAVALGADYLQGEYVGKTAERPEMLSDRCMQKIGLIQYGKKG